MITRPLDLESRLSSPPRDFAAVAWVNVGVIVLFFSLLGSRFVLAPGLLVELPAVDSTSAGAAATPVVIIYRRDNVILFEDGGMYTLKELGKPLAVYAKKNPGSTLLVKADKQVSGQALWDLGQLAASVGFAQMLVAGELTKPDNSKN